MKAKETYIDNGEIFVPLSRKERLTLFTILVLALAIHALVVYSFCKSVTKPAETEITVSK